QDQEKVSDKCQKLAKKILIKHLNYLPKKFSDENSAALAMKTPKTIIL
ncbi:35783_t:CDS:1, partial [Racocetra persica]